MKPGRCNDETGIHIANACTSDSSCTPLPLNSSNYSQSRCEDPWNSVELLPETWEHQLDVETEDERDRNHLLKVEDVDHYALKLPLLFDVQGKSIDTTDDGVGGDKDEKIDVD